LSIPRAIAFAGAALLDAEIAAGFGGALVENETADPADLATLLAAFGDSCS